MYHLPSGNILQNYTTIWMLILTLHVTSVHVDIDITINTKHSDFTSFTYTLCVCMYVSMSVFSSM